MIQNHHFKKVETGKHKYAIESLKNWFEPEFTCILDKKFYIDGILVFVPDITLMQETTIRAFYEVVNKHGLTGYKLGRIQSWCYRNYDVPVYEVSADWILDQTEKPDRILADKFETQTNK